VHQRSVMHQNILSINSHFVGILEQTFCRILARVEGKRSVITI